MKSATVTIRIAKPHVRAWQHFRIRLQDEDWPDEHKVDHAEAVVGEGAAFEVGAFHGNGYSESHRLTVSGGDVLVDGEKIPLLGKR